MNAAEMTGLILAFMLLMGLKFRLSFSEPRKKQESLEWEKRRQELAEQWLKTRGDSSAHREAARQLAAHMDWEDKQLDWKDPTRGWKVGDRYTYLSSCHPIQGLVLMVPRLLESRIVCIPNDGLAYLENGELVQLRDKLSRS